MIAVVIGFVIAAAVEDNPFWESPLGVAIGWVGAVAFIIATVAAGVAGLRSLWKHYRLVDSYMIERRRRDALLDQILSADGWPNGAESIIAAHRDLYQKLSLVDVRVGEMQKAIEQFLTKETP